ncbi:hypothetical protein JCM19294_1887 [Nonlabens tegetincola]|uniref:Uncharacterized protein n=1 Tax=Nonlabens tegetincola TaxID=323273 RepID=A0A090PZU9_9FLAO|nr:MULTISPECIES: hypothetical protein [Nonlabens]ALM21627.1 hypothetical protein AAT17_10460 [Nonlabens sp. MIC269]ARN71645.1 hypothetical protein BST91_08330 [Nonlabens tegetincola]GAK96374.1 hypothetical protein JCM19294_1887 [Nonlabens tegetincola]
MSQENQSVLFTPKGLNITTKIVAFYAAFYIITSIVPFLTGERESNVLMPDNLYTPVYFIAAIHAVVLLISVATLWLKKQSWVVTLFLIAVILACRFAYQEIANWVYATF